MAWRLNEWLTLAVGREGKSNSSNDLLISPGKRQPQGCLSSSYSSCLWVNSECADNVSLPAAVTALLGYARSQVAVELNFFSCHFSWCRKETLGNKMCYFIIKFLQYINSGLHRCSHFYHFFLLLQDQIAFELASILKVADKSVSEQAGLTICSVKVVWNRLKTQLLKLPR